MITCLQKMLAQKLKVEYLEKVEKSAIDHSQALMAEINTFFDNVAQSV